MFVLVSKQCVVLLIIDRERQQDLDERDAFTDRLKEEDNDKTGRVVSKSDRKVSKIYNKSIGQNESAIRLVD